MNLLEITEKMFLPDYVPEAYYNWKHSIEESMPETTEHARLQMWRDILLDLYYNGSEELSNFRRYEFACLCSIDMIRSCEGNEAYINDVKLDIKNLEFYYNAFKRVRSYYKKHDIDPDGKITPVVGVYAICKNEAKHVKSFMESASEADYVVVVDTGSDDSGITCEILNLQKISCELNYSTNIKIIEKTYDNWRFDVARNDALDALEELVGDQPAVFTSVDLDEVFHKGWADEVRKRWVPGLHRQAVYKYTWSHLQDGSPGRIFKYNKMHDAGWRWRYPVHEALYLPDVKYLNPVECCQLFDYVHLEHFPDNTKSRASYLPMLEQRVEEYPEDYSGIIYLAHEYSYRKIYDKSNEWLQRAIIHFRDGISSIDKASCYLFLGDNYRSLYENDQSKRDYGGYIDSKSAYQRAIAIEPTYREPYLGLAKLELCAKNYDAAIQAVLDGLSHSKRHYTWLERDASYSYEPYDILALAYYWKGGLINKYKSLYFATKAVSYSKDERLVNNVNSIMRSISVDETVKL